MALIGENLDEILKMATSLGEGIRRHPRYVALRAADNRVREDKAATDALEAYNQAAGEMARKERAGQPIEVEDKRKMEHLHQVVAANETVKSFVRAQADYAELMKKMNDAIFGGITGPDGEE